MILYSSNNNLVLILSLIAVAIVIIAVLVFLILKRTNKNKYLVKMDTLAASLDIDNKSQIDAYITRLANIAKKNENYVEISEMISKQFEKLMTSEKEKLVVRYKGLKERISNEKKIKRGLLDQIKSFENSVNQYLKEIRQIQKDLENYFVEGDRLRVRLTELQNKYQQILSDLDKYSSAISICKTELLNYLSDVEMYFDVFDGNLSSAKYKEADKNLDNIEEMVINLYGYIETIAQYCNMVDVVIPSQLEELFYKNANLEEQGYVVSHAKVNEVIQNVKVLLESCKASFKRLCFSEFSDISFDIQNKLAEVHARLDQEVVCKHELDEKYQFVSDKIAYASSEFISTKRSFYLMLDFYKLPAEYHEKFQNFQSNATKLTDLKREYDESIFVNAKNPASYMLIKVSKMENVADEVLDDIKFFNSYFNTTKEYVESTYEKTNSLLKEITFSIGRVRKSKCKPVYDKYIDRANNTLDLLKQVNQLLLKKPIEIEILHQSFASLVSNAEELVKLINNDLQNYNMVEKCIVFANPLRSQFVEVDKLLKEIEELFAEGDYIQAQEKLNYILNNYHPAAFDSFNG